MPTTMKREMWTNSRLKMWANCPMSEHLRYDREIVPLGRRQALDIGSAVHKGIETRSVDEAVRYLLDSVTVLDQQQSEDLEISIATAAAMVGGYLERFEPFQRCSPELQFELPILNAGGRRTGNHMLAGKIDAIAEVDGQHWIVEYKTAGRLDSGYFERLYVDDQITTYFYAAQRLRYKPVGVIYRVIRKPSIRMRKGETVAEYAERVKLDYAERPEFYFTEDRYYRTKDDLAEFERDLWRKVRMIETAKKRGWILRNTNQCSGFGTCPYLPLCSKQAGAELMYTTRAAHEELRGEEEESC